MQAAHRITDGRRHQNFANALFIFMLQAILSFLVGYQFFQDDFQFSVGGFALFISRFVCAILLHIRLEPEVRQGLNMLKYLNNHQELFSSVAGPYFVAHM